MKRKDIYLFAIVVLAQGIWICVGLLFDQTSSDLLILLPLSAGSFVCALAVAARRASARAWRTAGPVIAGLFLLPSLLVDISPFLEMAYLGAPSVALILAAALLKPGLDLREEGLPGSAGMLLGLSAALVAKSLYDLYWVMVWDNVWGTTYDWTGYLWLLFPLLAAAVASLALAVTLPDRTKLAALGYLLLVSASIFTVAAVAQRVDQHRLTERRAERIVEAIEAYYVQEGRYPQDLSQLTPRYALALPEPAILYSQDWCYDAGTDYYRLGYVTQEVEDDGRAAGHRRQLSIRGRVYKTQGEIPDLPSICARADRVGVR